MTEQKKRRNSLKVAASAPSDVTDDKMAKTAAPKLKSAEEHL